MSDVQDYTLSQLKKMGNLNPHLSGFADRAMINNGGGQYKDWIDRLYKDLHNIIAQIQKTANFRQEDKEDRFNIDITNSLSLLGYNASHDPWNNGHPDIVVENDRGFQWIGESKIHSSYDNLLEGFKQLSERYSSGSLNKDHGSVLVITKNENTKKLMANWQKTLSNSQEYRDCLVQKCTLNLDHDSFISTHTHSISGRDYTIRHTPINIRFKPTDKSATSSKKRKILDSQT